MDNVEKGLVITAIMVTIAAIIIVCCQGCSRLPGITFSPGAKTIAVQIAARHIGEKVAARYPEYIETAKTICKGIMATQSAEKRQAAFEAATALLLSKVVKDPALRADIADLLSMIEVDGVPVVIPVEGFQEGIKN